ncbi:MAG: hypothetical protein IJ785_05225 [Bacteroidales bacterium]|nr:hypothetical protein [Bacteroidales bacterium]
MAKTFLPNEKKFVSLHRLSTGRKTERKRIFSIPWIVNLDTSLKHKDGIRQMISHLYCIRFLATYGKWGYSRNLIFFMQQTMGVQAQLSEIGRTGWLHFFLLMVDLTEP